MYAELSLATVFRALELLSCLLCLITSLSTSFMFFSRFTTELRRVDFNKTLAKMAMATCDTIEALAINHFPVPVGYASSPFYVAFVFALAAGAAHYTSKCIAVACQPSRTSPSSPASAQRPIIENSIRA